MIDIRQTEDGDIDLSTGDFVLVEPTEQHQRDILIAAPGYYKESPTTGIDSINHMLESDTETYLRTVRKQFAKVAKLDDANNVVPLDIEEHQNFVDYITTINFAGLGVNVLSLPSDQIRYNVEVFYNPAYPAEIVEANVRAELDGFRIPQTYDARFYPQRMLEAVLAAEGVTTARLNDVEWKKATEEVYTAVGIFATLWAGFFEYANDSILTLTSINAVTDES